MNPFNKKDMSLKQRFNAISKVHFAYAGLLALQIIIFDAAQLITPAAVLKRWQTIALLLAVTAAVWYLAKTRWATSLGFLVFTVALVLTDIAVASSYVYDQRGMASKAVFLYLVPIVTAAVLKSRSALFATATLCVAAYSTTAITYFVTNFNEGYKIELYGEVGFYSAMFFVVANLVWLVSRPSPPK